MFYINEDESFHLSVWDETSGIISGKLSSLSLWDYCVPLDWKHIIQVPVCAWHSQLWLHIQKHRLNCLIVLWEHSRTNNSRAESKQSQGICFCSTWSQRWDSLTRGPLRLPLLGQCHPLLGRFAPCDWQNRPRDTAATTSTSATLRGLWAIRLLTHRVCSRGLIGGKLETGGGLGFDVCVRGCLT